MLRRQGTLENPQGALEGRPRLGEIAQVVLPVVTPSPT